MSGKASGTFRKFSCALTTHQNTSEFYHLVDMHGQNRTLDMTYQPHNSTEPTSVNVQANDSKYLQKTKLFGRINYLPPAHQAMKRGYSFHDRDA